MISRMIAPPVPLLTLIIIRSRTFILNKKPTLFFIELQYILAFFVSYSDCIAFILHMMLQYEMCNQT